MNIDVTSQITVQNGECISCMSCVSSCQVKNAIHLSTSANKKRITLALILILVILVIPTFISANAVALHEPIDEVTLSKDQIIKEGSAQGFKSMIKVQVILNKGDIEKITIIKHKEDARWFKQAIRVIDTITTTDSTNVDTISGATYSSQGIINATKNALGEDYIEQQQPNNRHRGH